MNPSPTIAARRDALTDLMWSLIMESALCSPEEKSSLRMRYMAWEAEMKALKRHEQELDDWWKIGKES